MRRREFIAIAGGTVAWSLATRLQADERQFRIGSLHQSRIDAPHHVAFYHELRTLGFVEGQNLIVDRTGYGLQLDQLPDHASTLADFKADVVLCGGDAAIRAAQQVTTAIPIVAVTDDMIGSGFVWSLAKPGANVTGISILATELDGKRQEILIEAVPGARRIAALADPNTTSAARADALRKQAYARGVELAVHWVSRVDDIKRSLDAAASAEAVNVLATPLLFNGRQIIMDRLVALRLPAIYQWPETAEEGGFLAYGPRFSAVYRQVARLISRVFAGTKAADIPVEQPIRFELVVNLKTAKLIGREIPAGLVVRADKVID